MKLDNPYNQPFIKPLWQPSWAILHDGGNKDECKEHEEDTLKSAERREETIKKGKEK